MKNRGNILVVVLAVFLLASVSAAGYFYLQYRRIKPEPTKTQLVPSGTLIPTQARDKTVNWKEYTNSRFGFKLKYPDSWYVDDKSNNNYVFINAEKEKQMTLASSSGNIVIWLMSEDVKAKTIDDFMDNFMSSINPATGTKENIVYKYLNKTTVGGKNAWLTTGGCCGSNGKNIFVLGDRKLLVITLEEITNPDFSKNIPIYDQILGTFKFIEGTPEEPRVTVPVANSKVTNPLTISGTVPPGWMFEGVFPLKLTDATGKVIAEGRGKETVPGSWQSGKAAVFSAKITFSTTAKSGLLVLSNDNPGGDPAKLKSFSIPVNF